MTSEARTAATLLSSLSADGSASAAIDASELAVGMRFIGVTEAIAHAHRSALTQKKQLKETTRGGSCRKLVCERYESDDCGFFVFFKKRATREWYVADVGPPHTPSCTSKAKPKPSQLAELPDFQEAAADARRCGLSARELAETFSASSGLTVDPHTADRARKLIQAAIDSMKLPNTEAPAAGAVGALDVLIAGDNLRARAAFAMKFFSVPQLSGLVVGTNTGGGDGDQGLHVLSHDLVVSLQSRIGINTIEPSESIGYVPFQSALDRAEPRVDPAIAPSVDKRQAGQLGWTDLTTSKRQRLDERNGSSISLSTHVLPSAHPEAASEATLVAYQPQPKDMDLIVGTQQQMAGEDVRLREWNEVKQRLQLAEIQTPATGSSLFFALHAITSLECEAVLTDNQVEAVEDANGFRFRLGGFIDSRFDKWKANGTLGLPVDTSEWQESLLLSNERRAMSDPAEMLTSPELRCGTLHIKAAVLKLGHPITVFDVHADGPVTAQVFCAKLGEPDCVRVESLPIAHACAFVTQLIGIRVVPHVLVRHGTEFGNYRFHGLRVSDDKYKAWTCTFTKRQRMKDIAKLMSHYTNRMNFMMMSSGDPSAAMQDIAQLVSHTDI